MPRGSLVLHPRLILPLLLALAPPFAASSCGRRAAPEESRGREPPPEAPLNPYFRRVERDVQQLMRMVRIRPDDARLRLDLGRKLLEGGLTAQGEAQLRAALERDPGLVEARVRLARLLWERGELDAALGLLEAGLERGESPELLVEKARVLLERGGEEARRAAEAALRRACEIAPRNAEAAYELGRFLLEAGREEEAAETLERAVTLDPTHLGAWFNLARARQALGDVEGAEEARRRHRRLARLDDLGFRRNADTFDASLALSRMLLEAGKVEEARTELERARETFADDPRSWIELARLLADAGRRDEARRAFDEALERFPDAPSVLLACARFLARTPEGERDRRRAVRLAERAAALTRRGDPQVLLGLADVRSALGDARGAYAAALEAQRLDPGDAEVREAAERYRRRMEKARG